LIAPCFNPREPYTRDILFFQSLLLQMGPTCAATARRATMAATAAAATAATATAAVGLYKL
jgi:hypothetical protein